MTRLLGGNGRYDFRIHTGRIEYETIADRIPPVPTEGIRIDCLALITLDDQHAIDFGNGVAAGIMLPGGGPITAGWFQWRQARQYRRELAALELDEDEGVLCLGRLVGGAEIQYRKGASRSCFHLWLDLDWPILANSDWYTVCAPYLRDMGKL